MSTYSTAPGIGLVTITGTINNITSLITINPFASGTDFVLGLLSVKTRSISNSGGSTPFNFKMRRNVLGTKQEITTITQTIGAPASVILSESSTLFGFIGFENTLRLLPNDDFTVQLGSTDFAIEYEILFQKISLTL